MEDKNCMGQNVNIFNREKIEVSGVVEVLSSTDKEVFLKLDGVIACITGEKMKIVKLLPEEKLLLVSGVILGISFKNKIQKKSILKRVFK